MVPQCPSVRLVLVCLSAVSVFYCPKRCVGVHCQWLGVFRIWAGPISRSWTRYACAEGHVLGPRDVYWQESGDTKLKLKHGWAVRYIAIYWDTISKVVYCHPLVDWLIDWLVVGDVDKMQNHCHQANSWRKCSRLILYPVVKDQNYFGASIRSYKGQTKQLFEELGNFSMRHKLKQLLVWDQGPLVSGTRLRNGLLSASVWSLNKVLLL